MGRAERRRYRRRQGQTAAVRLLLALTAVVLVSGLAGRVRQEARLRVEPVAAPTATPLPPAYDQTPTEREIVLPAQTWYAIQTGVYTQRSAAQARCGDYADRGAPGVAVQEDGRYRVFIAAFSDKVDAAAVREKLSERQQVDTYLYEWVCPEVTLRLSGMAGQLDAVQSGLSMAMQAAVLLRDYATAYDQGGVTAEDVEALVAGLDSEFGAWRDTVRRQFDQPYPMVVQAELALADAWDQASRAVLGAPDATARSAAMKTQAIMLYARVIEMRAALESE